MCIRDRFINALFSVDSIAVLFVIFVKAELTALLLAELFKILIASFAIKQILKIRKDILPLMS